MGAGVVERARLESVCTSKGYRGFESLPIRHLHSESLTEEVDVPRGSCGLLRGTTGYLLSHLRCSGFVHRRDVLNGRNEPELLI